MTTKHRPTPLPILEFDGNGRHRIVVSKNDGTCESCDWAPVTETIFFKGLYTAGSDTPLPSGIFAVRELAYQVLA